LAISNFPSVAFVVEGDPEAIAESGRTYGRIAALAAEAGDGIRGIHSGSWSGTSGDRFRERLAALPPRLDTAERAFAQVAQALTAFAEILAAAQQQMATLHDDAEQAFRLLAAARVEAEDEGGTPDRVTALEATLDGQLTAAAGIRARVQEAAREAGNRIRAAERLEPGRLPAGLPGARVGTLA
jgi:hypothetical protein